MDQLQAFELDTNDDVTNGGAEESQRGASLIKMDVPKVSVAPRAKESAPERVTENAAPSQPQQSADPLRESSLQRALPATELPMLTKLLRRSVEVQRREDRRRHDLKWQRRRQEEEDLLRGAVNVQAFASEGARKPHGDTRAHRLEEKRAALHAREVAASGKEEKP